MENVAVVSRKALIIEKVNNINSKLIDYYFNFKINNSKLLAENIIISSFRVQIFTIKSNVVVVLRVQNGKLKLEGIYTSLGEKTNE